MPTTSNLPLRVGKGSCYEGGVRVPMIVYWPGVTKPGSVCDTPVISMDLFPTFMEITGTPERSQDCGSRWREPGAAAQADRRPEARRAVLALSPLSALSEGRRHAVQRDPQRDFKLIEFLADMHVELYNLRDDIGEQHDLASQMPEKVDELRNRLHAWRKEVGAQMPTPNPKYDPTKPEANLTPKQQKTGQPMSSVSCASHAGKPSQV